MCTFYGHLLLMVVLHGYCNTTTGRSGVFNISSPALFRLDAFIIDTVPTQSKQECVTLCFDTPECVSVGYNENGDNQQCYSTASPRNYNGTWNLTYNNIPCQRWDSMEPHGHSRVMPSFQFPGASTMDEVGNYCRNPDSEADLWCYTTDENVRWDYCNIYRCFEHNCRLYHSSTTEYGEQSDIQFYNRG